MLRVHAQSLYNISLIKIKLRVCSKLKYLLKENMRGLISNYLSAASNPWWLCVFFRRETVLSSAELISEIVSLDLGFLFLFLRLNLRIGLYSFMSPLRRVSVKCFKRPEGRSVMLTGPLPLSEVCRIQVPQPAAGCCPQARLHWCWQTCGLKCKWTPRTRVLSTSLLSFHWISVCPL